MMTPEQYSFLASKQYTHLDNKQWGARVCFMRLDDSNECLVMRFSDEIWHEVGAMVEPLAKSISWVPPAVHLWN